MKLGFCGIGNMGGPMAARLLEAGHDLVVWNRTPEKAEPLGERGATVASTPAEVARASDAVITMLADPPALEAVVFGAGGLFEGAPEGSTLLDMSTVGPEAVRSIAARLPRWEVIDAPVRGGPARAGSGELKILVGATEEAFARWAPVLAAMGEPRHVGGPGTGAAAKVLNNLAVVSLVALFGEAMALGDALGLNEEQALDILGETPLGATMHHQWPRVSGAEASPSFRLRLAAKDLELALAVAEGEGFRLPMVGEAAGWLRAAGASGLADHDQAAVVAFVRQRSV